MPNAYEIKKEIKRLKKQHKILTQQELQAKQERLQRIHKLKQCLRRALEVLRKHKKRRIESLIWLHNYKKMLRQQGERERVESLDCLDFKRPKVSFHHGRKTSKVQPNPSDHAPDPGNRMTKSPSQTQMATCETPQGSKALVSSLSDSPVAPEARENAPTSARGQKRRQTGGRSKLGRRRKRKIGSIKTTTIARPQMKKSTSHSSSLLSNATSFIAGGLNSGNSRILEKTPVEDEASCSRPNVGARELSNTRVLSPTVIDEEMPCSSANVVARKLSSTRVSSPFNSSPPTTRLAWLKVCGPSQQYNSCKLTEIDDQSYNMQLRSL